jgi:hypothetical protein
MSWAAISADGQDLSLCETESQALAIGATAVPVSEDLAAFVRSGGRMVWDGTAVQFDQALLDGWRWDALRRERDALLAACDWTQLPDVSEAVALAWRPYRQALRDLPEATIDPLAPSWPVPPT